MTRFPENFETSLIAAAPHGVNLTTSTDDHGVSVMWCELADRDDLSAVGECLRSYHARLAMVTANKPPAPEEEEEEHDEEDEGAAEAEAHLPEQSMSFGGTPQDGTSYELVYHFDVGGDYVNVVAFLPAGGSIASLTPLFRSADWPEREIMEIYSVTIANHPDPRRLFLDESIEGAVLDRLIPFSQMANASTSDELWARVMAAAKEA
ncbi:NADH-quinone oxidoreductase subunit C [uncultured Cohaesibacter sp.]|uniref:NADH-quinone oxidoreductase subunit C n=1 Tax=uncultured Cohaesibacter sp. TaxID=1002546 RepID=UPI00292DE70A|nr:NADH-quinone oxidoreductase subunit C [uncultured Cohaesibacter sp.]